MTKNFKTDSAGRVLHDGDCHWYDIKICTCGLIHHLAFQPLDDARRAYPNFVADETEHCANLYEFEERIFIFRLTQKRSIV